MVAWSLAVCGVNDARRRFIDLDGQPLAATETVLKEVWTDSNSQGEALFGQADSTLGPVRVQRYDALGAPLGAEILVDSEPAARFTEFNMREDGGFDVVAESVEAELGLLRFDSAGQKTFEEFQVNNLRDGSQTAIDVASDASSNFVLVWQSLGSFGDDSDLTSIQARRRLGLFLDDFEDGTTNAWDSQT
ncbi:MAG: hypothetical protein AAF725_18790, partial [Acidobacteriota bacterium]